MPKDDAVRLRHMLDAAQEAIYFVQERTRADLDRDRMLIFHLWLRNFTIFSIRHHDQPTIYSATSIMVRTRQACRQTLEGSVDFKFHQ